MSPGSPVGFEIDKWPWTIQAVEELLLNTQNISVVLVEPQGPLNIGSVCRAMLNFGLVDLRLVNPQTNHLQHAARQMAVKATTVLESAVVYTSLADALADCTLSFGTTRRFGRYREDMLHPDEAARQLLPATVDDRVALVFGREDRGCTPQNLIFVSVLSQFRPAICCRR